MRLHFVTKKKKQKKIVRMVLTIYGFDKTETQSFYSDKIIFITGGTGFVGSTLVEKLLRTCPDIKKIYLLIRNKKGKAADERLKDIFDDEYWQKLKLQYPNFKEKLALISGDLLEKKLALSEHNKNIIINEVQIVFHVAATVRFDENLKKAAYINIQATKDMLELCSQIKDLQSMVHVSTAYSQCILPELEEKFYPQMRDPEEFLEFCSGYTEEQMHEMTPSIIKGYPNTYTFTKGLAEILVQNYSNKLPITIVRPSIVMGCWQEPIQGWTDNIFGPFGVIVGIGIGLIRVIYMNEKYITDVVPVDMVVSCMIAAGVDASKRDFRNKEMQIYNFSSSNQNPITWGAFNEWFVKYGNIYASVQTIWIYLIFCVTNEYQYALYKYLLHILPAQIVDMGLRIRGQKPKLVKLYERIHKLIDLLKFFGTHEWIFRDDNTQKLFKQLSVRDQILYNFDIKDLQWDVFLYHSARVVRTHLLKDPLTTIPQAQRKMKILTIAHYTILFFLCAIICSFFYFFYTLIF